MQPDGVDFKLRLYMISKDSWLDTVSDIELQRYRDYTIRVSGKDSIPQIDFFLKLHAESYWQENPA